MIQGRSIDVMFTEDDYIKNHQFKILYMGPMEYIPPNVVDELLANLKPSKIEHPKLSWNKGKKTTNG